MRCISVRDPFATALVRGFKDYENRSWRISPGPCLIHVAQRVHVNADAAFEFAPALRDIEHMPGRVIGAVLFDEPVDVREVSSPWASGPLCWPVIDAFPFVLPREVKGRLGTFDVRLPRALTRSLYRRFGVKRAG